jgi:hypothetical protein
MLPLLQPPLGYYVNHIDALPIYAHLGLVRMWSLLLTSPLLLLLLLLFLPLAYNKQGVPSAMRSNAKLYTYFNTLYPQAVASVHVPQDLGYLKRLLRVTACNGFFTAFHAISHSCCCMCACAKR